MKYVCGPVALLATLLLAPVTLADSRDQCGEQWVEIEAANTAMFYGYTGIYTMSVDVNAWDKMDYKAKVGLVDTLRCAFGPEDGRPYTVEVLSNMTNNRVGWWEQGTGLIVVERY